MLEIYIDPKLWKTGQKVHPTQIKQAVMQIKPKRRQRFNKDYNEVVELGGAHIFLVYQLQKEGEREIIYVKQARYAKKY